MRTESLWEPQPGRQSDFSRRQEDIVLFGGSKGGGKTDSLLFEVLRQVDNPNYKGVLIRRIFPQLQEIIDRAHKFYPKLGARWVGALNRYVFPSGAFVEFGHCQNELDKERYQGKEYTFIGFDQLEEFLESQFNFIMAQNRTSDPTLKCYVRATANPGSVGHWWVKRRFIDGRIPGQTYTETYEMPNGSTLTRTSCFIKSTVYDNPVLVKANPTYLANLMSLPEMERKAYLDGDWNVFTGQSAFDGHGLLLQEKKIEKPQWVGYIRPSRNYFEVVPDPMGPLKIWNEPADTKEYSIGADVCEGVKGGDYASAHVVDKKTWEVVAHWHGQVDPFRFAEELDSLGRYYGIAEMAVEVNGPGVATIEKLLELGYDHMYQYEPKKYGWRTDTRGRHNMLSTFRDAVRDSSVKVRDQDTLDEMFNFTWDEKTGKMEAREDCNDDRVMSLAIALQTIRINPFKERGRNGYSPITVSSLTGTPRRRTGY